MLSIVTGGAGFIGSHLCRYLLNKGQQVICIDNFSSGRRENILELLPDRNFELLEKDASIPFEYDADRVYNLACPASPEWYTRDAVKTMHTVVNTAQTCVQFAIKSGARILQASTSEVYGSPHVHPQHENYWGNVNPVGTRSCYTEAKRFAETILTAYHKQFGIDIRIARIFNTYGPNMRADDGRVIPGFINQALSGERLSVYGDGTQTRSFCYIDNLVEGLYGLMENCETHQPVNLGNDQEISIADLANTILALTESTSTISFLPLPEDDPQKRKPDISRAEGLFNFRPKISLEKGLRATIQYMLQTKNCQTGINTNGK